MRSVLIGEVGVDSGQLMICDPVYIENEWDAKHSSAEIYPEVYVDNKTGRTYAYAGFELPKGESADVRFENWEAPLDDYSGRTPNQVRADNWTLRERERPKFKGEFSYRGASEATLSKDGFGQLNFKLGHAGAGVASSTYCGDGCYPVYADVDEDGSICALHVHFVE